MTTMTRSRTLTATLPGVRTLSRVVEARRQRHPERAERRRFAREVAAYPATRGVGFAVLPGARSNIS
jgi:hypothetical protein